MEVGTGFHPELTGRENIYLNGAILGITKAEIKVKEAEMIDFSCCERYIDTPVKRYSCGMTVRLAFSVAAHLEPDILVVDEVLAVGDAEFQKKAIGKMQDISKGEGRTVLFVSHNMASVRQLCNRGMLIHNGQIFMSGLIDSVVDKYMEFGVKANIKGGSYYVDPEKIIQCATDGMRILDIKLNSINEINKDIILSGSDLEIEIEYECHAQFVSPAFVVKIQNKMNQEMMRFANIPLTTFNIEPMHNKGKLKLKIFKLPLTCGEFKLEIGFIRACLEKHFMV